MKQFAHWSAAFMPLQYFLARRPKHVKAARARFDAPCLPRRMAGAPSSWIALPINRERFGGRQVPPTQTIGRGRRDSSAIFRPPQTSIVSALRFALFFLILPAAFAADDKTVSIPITGTATKLSSVTYFEPPNDQLVKIHLTGDEMTPLPGALFNVKNLTIQQFDLDGKSQAVITAPQCTYAQLDGLASSPGHFQIKLAEDRIRVEGDGFLWNQTNQFLIISNKVLTTIKVGNWKLPTL